MPHNYLTYQIFVDDILIKNNIKYIIDTIETTEKCKIYICALDGRILSVFGNAFKNQNEKFPENLLQNFLNKLKKIPDYTDIDIENIYRQINWQPFNN